MPGVTEAAMETEHRQKKKSKKVEAAEVSPDASDVKKKKKRKSDVLAEENGEASEQKKVKTEKTEIENPFSVANFRISDAVKQKLKEKGIDALFDIQAQTFDIVYDGNDLVGRARTGQGKTLAFVLPIIESLSRNNKDKGQLKSGRAPSVVVLAPTRELAKQVHADFEYYGRAAGLTTVCVYGGSQYGPQENALRRGVDVVVGTPGRVKDFLEKRVLNLKTLKFRVLDEADEMLNMGFVEDVELILGCVEDNSTVQTLLFSATMPHWVKEIANKFLKPNRKTVDLVGDDKMKASRSVRHLLLSCGYQVRPQVIADVIKVYGSGGRIIVFTETKNDASELAGILGTHVARALHGDIPQGQREVTLAGFRSGKFSVLVATDVAARGLDINDVQLIIQCEPPKDVETYIHRSGRTGRAGNTGIAVMLYDRKKEYMIPQIEGRAGFKFERITAPQPTDIARESGSTAAAAVSEVTDSVVPLFKVAAEELVKKSGLSTIDVLSKALAKISGYTSVSRRSLLTSHDDATTLLFRCQKSMYNPGYVFNILRGFLSEEVIGEVKRMTLTADSKGAVFDVPSKLVDEFIGGDDDFSIEIAEKLPELLARPENSNNSNNRNGYTGGRNGGGGGGGGGRFGGRGRGSFRGGRGRRY